MTPIVAVVDAETLTALDHAAAAMPTQPLELRRIMKRNGWTNESVLAGQILRAVFTERDAAVTS